LSGYPDQVRLYVREGIAPPREFVILFSIGYARIKVHHALFDHYCLVGNSQSGVASYFGWHRHGAKLVKVV
jgi:hypothetical protein